MGQELERTEVTGIRRGLPMSDGNAGSQNLSVLKLTGQ